MIRIGTSGFSYKDWVGPVYPEKMPAKDWLAFYAAQFSTVELNVTFYRLPSRVNIEAWLRKTPDDFLFTVKAFRGLTHERENPDFAAFTGSIRPLAEAGKLGCVLAQFPNSFHPVPENKEYLKRMCSELPDLPLVAEFRHTAWAKPETFEMLRGLGMGYCCVDEPQLRGLMPPAAVSTSPVGYIRFHGRNAAHWYEHKDPAERYDYRYSEKELEEWIPKIRKVEKDAEETYVYFNNHPHGHGVAGAKVLGRLLNIQRKEE
ncbi:MAG: DUF72 domain-containing protein [Anaerolineales bacterium]|nr:DUF72 domain-containing protein [Anaerolineales bacterium]